MQVPPGEPPPPPEKPDSEHDVSITVSPLHLFFPLLELEVEARVFPHFGMGIIAGYGAYTVDDPESAIDGDTFAVYELGAQFIGYPLQDFESLQLGAELLWIRIEADDLAGRGITGIGSGVGVGPLVGYKVLSDSGFTFFVQGGFQYLLVKAEASDGAGNTQTEEQNDVIPLLNLNLGWSF